MFGNLFAGMLLGFALMVCLVAWGEKLSGGGAARGILAVAVLLAILALLVFANS